MSCCSLNCAAGELDLEVCAVDGSHMRALKGEPRRPVPVDSGRPGSKHNLVCDAGGLTLAVTLTGGNRNDITQLIPLVDAVPPIAGRGLDALACAHGSCSQTAATTTTSTAAHYALAASLHASPAAALRTAPAG